MTKWHPLPFDYAVRFNEKRWNTRGEPIPMRQPATWKPGLPSPAVMRNLEFREAYRTVRDVEMRRIHGLTPTQHMLVYEMGGAGGEPAWLLDGLPVQVVT